MKKLDMSEYDSDKKYPEDIEFVLDDTPREIPVPDFLKDKEKSKE